jgi:glutamine amidotransferase-like uncharacterized protein
MKGAEKNIKILLLLTVFGLIISLYGFKFCHPNVRAIENYPVRKLNNTKIALYNGPGAARYSVLAMRKCFEWMGCNIINVTGNDIIGGILDDFDVLAWPGGDYVSYWQLGLEGKSKIQNFISSGGGYFGICAGAWYASDYMIWKADPAFPPPTYKIEGDQLNLDLFNGVAVGPIEDITPFYTGDMTRIDIVNHTHPITKSMPNYMQIQYFGGPELLPYGNADVTILGIYNITETPAIVAFEYGNGRVFLSSPHAEKEEDSERDGIPIEYTIEWPDEGSDWPLLLKAMEWIAKIPDLSISSFGLIEIFSIGIITELVLIWQFIRKKLKKV